MKFDDAIGQHLVEQTLRRCSDAQVFGVDVVGRIERIQQVIGHLLFLRFTSHLATDAHAVAADVQFTTANALQRRGDQIADIVCPVGRGDHLLDADPVHHPLLAVQGAHFGQNQGLGRLVGDHTVNDHRLGIGRCRRSGCARRGGLGIGRGGGQQQHAGEKQIAHHHPPRKVLRNTSRAERSERSSCSR